MTASDTPGGARAQETGGAVDNVKETNRLSAENKSSSLVSSVAWTTGDPAELDSNHDVPRLQSSQLLDLPTPNITRPVRTAAAQPTVGFCLVGAAAP
jgi:hypothetical protein